MRKLITGAVIASATLALTGAAIAQVTSQDGTSTLDATLSPKKVGTKNKPKSHSLRREARPSTEPGTTVEVDHSSSSARASSSAARASRSATRTT